MSLNTENEMSHIPNSAMPHAVASETAENDAPKKSRRGSLGEQAGKVADLARENPKTAIAAGAAVVAGLAAAAAIPLVRGRKASGSTGGAAKSKKTKA
jgi:hypothetical protein